VAGALLVRPFIRFPHFIWNRFVIIRNDLPGMSVFYISSTDRIQEEHRLPLYCAQFNYLSEELYDYFATVGSNRVNLLLIENAILLIKK
jgi:hypothetical protein